MKKAFITKKGTHLIPRIELIYHKERNSFP